MTTLFAIDWQAMFVPALGLAELVLRGSLMYVALFFILRFIGRRQSGHFGPADILVMVLIADASQNALGAEYRSLTEGIVLVLTIVAWDYAIDWLGFRYPALRQLLRSPPLHLVENGRLLRRNMRAEMLSREELMSQLREQGIDDLSEVKSAHLEGDGQMSVLKKKG